MCPFAIDVIRLISDPDLDQCMVAGVAAYTVGGMCTNTIGGAASTAVGLGYLLEAGEAISIKCGKAAIALLKDGAIAIAGGRGREPAAHARLGNGAPGCHTDFIRSCFTEKLSALCTAQKNP